jgi:dolichol-phosphate mannosyltransferase
MQKICLMLPAYNEELSLPPLLDKVRNLTINSGIKIEVLVVNDGSKDRTLEVCKENGVNVLDLQPNGGLANAMRQGFIKVLETYDDNDLLITMDADDSHNPGLIPRMIGQIWEGSDIVIASRYREGSRIYGLDKLRKFLSYGAGLMFRLYFGLEGVRDYTCGFRAYKIGFLRKGSGHYGDKFIEQVGFACMAEILIKLGKIKPIIHEVPFILRYDQKQGESKMNLGKTIKQTLTLLSIK